MLYVFYGTDTKAVRERAFLLVHEYEEAGASVVRIDAERYVPGLFADLVGAVSLFGGEETYLIDTPSQSEEMYAACVQYLPALAESPHTFIVIEAALLAAEKRKFEPHATKLVEVKGETAERFNSFALADALAERDRKRLWLLLQDARAAGLSAEELIGTLWWQLKTIRLAVRTRSACEAGMKDFPYNKAKRAEQHFKTGELDQLARTLLAVWHEGHAGTRDIDLALEAWTLGV